MWDVNILTLGYMPLHVLNYLRAVHTWFSQWSHDSVSICNAQVTFSPYSHQQLLFFFFCVDILMGVRFLWNTVLQRSEISKLPRSAPPLSNPSAPLGSENWHFPGAAKQPVAYEQPTGFSPVPFGLCSRFWRTARLFAFPSVEFK